MVRLFNCRGDVVLSVHYGTYVAEWSVDGQPYHATFRVDPGSPRTAIALTTPTSSSD